jgi:hypothetical protein
MTEVSPNQLRLAVQQEHGGKATLTSIVWVDEQVEGKPAWQGLVHVFELAGHRQAKRAYAWSSQLADGKRRFYAILHVGPVTGPQEAVRAALVAESRGKT